MPSVSGRLLTTDHTLPTGIIFFKETLLQSTASTSFVEVLKAKGILSGIKVDEARMTKAEQQTVLCSP